METEDETYYDFEEWEGDAYFFEKEDWVGLLKLREERDKNRRSDLHAQERYAEALNLNKKYKETLKFLTPLYKKYYDTGFGIHEILDALYGLGKTENEFDWIEKPTILKLDQNTFDICIEFLKNKRKPVSIFRLYENLLMRSDYLTFKEEELSDYLLKHAEFFDITGDRSMYFDIELKLSKKR